MLGEESPSIWAFTISR